MNTHTAKTLSLYLGGDIYYPHEGTFLDPGVYRLITCNIQLNSISFFSEYYPIEIDLNDDCLPIYPILKTSRDLVDDMLEDSYEFDDPQNLPAIFLGVIERLKLGYLAMENKESPTGYVDLFGRPCVTPQMVEKGYDSIRSII